MADLERRFRDERQALLRRRAARHAEIAAGAAARLPARDRGRPRRDLAGGAGAGRPRRPAGGDHRPGRAEDDDQRPQLGRPRLHGRLRGRPQPDLVERRRRPARRAGRRPPRRSPSRRPRRPTGSTRRRRRSSSGRAAGTSRSATCWSTAGPVSASLFDAGLYLFHNAAEALRRGLRPVLLPAEAREPPRGAPLERRLRPRPGRRSASRAAASGRPCSSRRSSPRSRWTRSCSSCASTPRA